MPGFETFEDILDFAILQEKAAQQYYGKLAEKAASPQIRSYYQNLAGDEARHEEQLLELKKQKYDLAEPDIKMLRDSGYLDAMPAKPAENLRDAIRFSLKKEKSARMLYSLLADSIKSPDCATLFKELAAQEQLHADYFQQQLDEI